MLNDHNVTLASVAYLVEHGPMLKEVKDSIPGQSACSG